MFPRQSMPGSQNPFFNCNHKSKNNYNFYNFYDGQRYKKSIVVNLAISTSA